LELQQFIGVQEEAKGEISMKPKQIAILGVLIAGAVAAVLIKPSGAPGNQGKVGSVILTSTEAATITGVDLTDKAGTVTKLIKGDEGAWTIGEDGFPVDGNRLGQFFDAIGQIQITRRVGKDKSSFSGVGLEKPSTVVVLRAADKTLVDLKIGDSRPGGGVYAAFAESEESYLLDKSPPMDSAPGYWELKTLVDVDAAGLKSVEFTPAIGSELTAVTVSREAADKPFEVVGLAAGEQKNEPTVTAVQSLLTQLQFTNKFPVESGTDKEAMEHSTAVAAYRFDGARYNIAIGKSGAAGSEKWFAKISTVDPDGKEPTSAKDKNLNALTAKWSFEIPSYLAGKFGKSRADFVAPLAKPDAG
jgi:hypothetical protein